MRLHLLVALIFLSLSAPAFAAEPSGITHRLPPPGIKVNAEALEKLSRRVHWLRDRLARLQESLAKEREKKNRNDAPGRPIAPLTPPWDITPDIEIFLKAVEFAVAHGEFYAEKDVQDADKLLEVADQRLIELAKDPAPRDQLPWTAPGHQVLGYRSTIDDSVQPYGLTIPKDAARGADLPLYVWLHGRGDTQPDLQFIRGRLKGGGPLMPEGALVLQPFGRHCNAYKFAGETDVFEAIADVSKRFRVNPRRIIIAGFSMGGAGAWHLGAHHAHRFAAVHAGAGFAETALYQRLDRSKVPAYEQTLWRLYDAPDYVRNLFNIPVIAYSGENDKQIQAARVMEAAYKAEGRELKHLIGPGMGHAYHPEKLAEVREFLAKTSLRPRDDGPCPIPHSLQTRTLRYAETAWIKILNLNEHWRDTRIDIARNNAGDAVITTKNVRAFHVKGVTGSDQILVDGQSFEAQKDGAGPLELVRKDDRWTLSSPVGRRRPRRTTPKARESDVLIDPARPHLYAKAPGLQGPIDDVWYEPFLVVTPSKPCAHPAVQKWMETELAYFLERWPRLFRGKPRLKRDVDVTNDDMSRYHLVIWGDRNANAVLAKIAHWLPIAWDEKELHVGNRDFDPANHVPVMIYPNPWFKPAWATSDLGKDTTANTNASFIVSKPASRKYIVLNSGPTFRSAHDGTNSQQTPKLPDWAIIDLSQKPNESSPGKIVAADFFDEHWQLKPPALGAPK